MANGARRKRKPAQKGVQAIFTEEHDPKRQTLAVAGILTAGVGAAVWITAVSYARSPIALASAATLLVMLGAGFSVCYFMIRMARHEVSLTGIASSELEAEGRPGRRLKGLPIKSDSKRRVIEKKGSRFRISKTVVGVMLLVTVASLGVHSWQSQQNIGDGPDVTKHSRGTNDGVVRRTGASFVVSPPRFYQISNIAEATVTSNRTYTGTIRVNLGDFLIIQISYSSGTGGNLPDIARVIDTQSNTYSRQASVSLGVSTNFWEQAWTTTASANAALLNVTVSPSWSSCQATCVTSVIMTMKMARYTGVTGVGAWAATGVNSSSTYQSVRITTTQANSTIVELLSHGAANNCSMDPPQAHSGQAWRDCYSSTTERTEFFDHTVQAARTYNESYSWVQFEVQRGIYLELKGNISNPLLPHSLGANQSGRSYFEDFILMTETKDSRTLSQK